MARRNVGNTSIQTFESDLEYILHRPEIYIGSIQEIKINDFVYINNELTFKEITYNPGLFKIVDEVISNSVDEAIRNNFKVGTNIKVTFNKDQSFLIEDDGNGVPVGFDTKLKKYSSELVFSNLKTGSNFDDNSNSELLGLNGVGVSLTNIFSSYFSVYINDGKSIYRQKFSNNLTKIEKPSVSKSTSNSTFTKITFTPNYNYFKISDECLIDLPLIIEKRIRNLAFAYPEIRFKFNGKSVSPKKPKDLFGSIDENFIFAEGEKFRLAILFSENDFKQISIVNGGETKEGGTHVDYVINKIVEYVREYIKKKFKIQVKPSEIKNHLFLFLALRTPKRKFFGQTKNLLVTNSNIFSDRIDDVLTDKILNKLVNNEKFIQSIVEIYQLRKEVKEKKKIKQLTKGKKRVKLAKLVEAQSKNKERNILMIAEGDSALNELINVRNPHVAGIPIRGKLKNVFNEKDIDVIKTEELRNLMQAIGLEIGKKAKDLNYGKIGILSDQDYDGDAIAGLLINFFFKFWPELFDEERIVRVLSPLFIAKKNKKIKRFYSHKEFESWIDEHKDWKIIYNKGLGSLGPEEYEIMINDPKLIVLKSSENSQKMIDLVYSNNSENRKLWLKEVK